MKATRPDIASSAHARPESVRRKPARGIDMLSAMGWWGYATILIVCVLGLLTALYTFSRSGSEATNLNQLASATLKVGRTQAGFGSANLNAVLYTANAIPSGYTYDSGTIYNQWNGTVSVVGKKSYFTVTSTSVPSSECISITQSLASGGVASYLTVGGTKITVASDIAAINTACGAANSSVTNSTVTIVMYVGSMTAA